MCLSRSSAWGARLFVALVVAAPTTAQSQQADELHLELQRARDAREVGADGLSRYAVRIEQRSRVLLRLRRESGFQLVQQTEHIGMGYWERDAPARLLVIRAQTLVRTRAKPRIEDGALPALPIDPNDRTVLPSTGLSLFGGVLPPLLDPLSRGSDSLYGFVARDTFTLSLSGHPTVAVREIGFWPISRGARMLEGVIWVDRQSGVVLRLEGAATSDLLLTPDGKLTDASNGPSGFLSGVRIRVSRLRVEFGLVEGGGWLPTAQHIDVVASFAGMSGVAGFTAKYRYLDSEYAQATSWRETAVAERSDSSAKLVNGPLDQVDCGVRSPDLIVCRPRKEVDLLDGGEFRILRDFEPRLVGGNHSLARESQLSANASRGAESSSVTAVGFGAPRYNRAEGASVALFVSRTSPRGLQRRLAMRASADPRALSLTYSGGRGDGVSWLFTLRDLVVANDAARSLSVPASAAALMVGRDEGLYFRRTGVEVHCCRQASLGTVSVFAERHETAEVSSGYSVLPRRHGSMPLTNVAVSGHPIVGVRARWRLNLPAASVGHSAHLAASAEAAQSQRAYVRAVLEASGERPIGPTRASVAATSGWVSAHAPTHRRIWLGGSHTLRSVRAASLEGLRIAALQADLGVPLGLGTPYLTAEIGAVAGGVTALHRAGYGVGVALWQESIRFEVVRDAQGRLPPYFYVRFGQP